ncbi:SDR family oxidoreductase [Williamsia deligens]|uniref:SDR family oxidoreductase n=1 Tax=Williamsia deligens TaxID=321325 RepID=A0ABW3G4U2_9NOCA|nr:SDR family NAD(P)-dependent oxidoreductase [Williamsia deligens]MCP2194065.1 Short-chain dehydrogenase involved in D-alanine esterification of teichoic acids [Williamsia deligens]
MDMTGRTIVIPGATSGIGRALAVALHQAGNTVIAGGRRRGLLDELAAEHPGIEAVVVDVADPASIAAATADVLDRFPQTDTLITMAGFAEPEDLTTSGFVDTAERIVTTNILGTVRLVGAFTEHLAQMGSGTIVTVSSGLAFTPLAPMPTYSATKAFVHAFTDSLRIQLRDSGVRVRELVPPAVQTEIFAGQSSAEWAMPLDAFVAEVMDLLGKDDDEIVVDDARALRDSEVAGNRAALMDQLAHLI